MLTQNNKENLSIGDAFAENFKRNYDLIVAVQNSRDGHIIITNSPTIKKTKLSPRKVTQKRGQKKA